MVGEDECAAIPQHQNDERRSEELADGVGAGLTNGDSVGSVTEFVGGFVKAVCHLVFSGEGFDDAHAAERFFQLRHGLAPFVLCVETLVFEFSADASHHPSHQREDDDGEDGQLPGGVDEHAEVANQQDGVLDEHVQRAGDGVFDFVHVAAHACNDVTFSLVGKEGQGERDDFVIDLCPDVAHDAGAHRNHDSDGSKIASCLEKRRCHEEDANDEERVFRAVGVHQLRSVPIHVVHHDVFDAHSGGSPRNEFIFVLVDSEEQLQHRNDGDEGKDVQDGRKEVEEE